jgi:glycosyltransferase involved in cell wall biosynthesis
MFARSLQQYPAQPEIAQREAALRERLAREAAAAAAALPARISDPDDVKTPMVSILMPTHNRPDYAELALQSALAQTWRNIEIVISDNSDNDDTERRFAPYIAQHPCIRYLRVPSCTALENFLNCYDHARGEYINFLMDDDLFHPHKIAAMMHVMLTQPGVGLVTSCRQLIDGNGNAIKDVPAHLGRAFETDTRIQGRALGMHLCTVGNIVGEPTTVLYRKSDAGPQFGMYMGNQYSVSSDLATWLTVLSKKDGVYLKDAYSSFRIHGGQDQRATRTQIAGQFEGLQILSDVWDQRYFFESAPGLRGLLGTRLAEVTSILPRLPAAQLRDAVDTERAVSLIRRAAALMLQPE